MIEWIKCSDRMPEYKKEVLLLNRGTGCEVGKLRKKVFESESDIWFYKDSEAGTLYFVTHWAEINYPEAE